MSEAALLVFLDSPYNMVADVKMYYFFADISRFALITIAVLFFLSLFIRNFWCRFLCPYGALLGIFSLISPLKIKRNTETCIDCTKCAKVCPSFIKVNMVKTVYSDECTTCLNCTDACPIANTLELKTTFKIRKISKKMVAFGILILFVFITGLGMITGNWQNKIKIDEYLYHQRHLHSYGHPTGTNEIKELNEDAKNRGDNSGSSTPKINQ
jgi:polyferredoxin